MNKKEGNISFRSVLALFEVFKMTIRHKNGMACCLKLATRNTKN